MRYQWQGEPVIVEFGYSEVKPDTEKPLMWYNYECDLAVGTMGIAKIPSIEITYGDSSFVLANHFGLGVEKLRRGGWPNFPHASLPDNSFNQDNSFVILEFDIDGIKKLDKERDAWMQKTNPEEFEKLQSLKAMINKRNQ